MAHCMRWGVWPIVWGGVYGPLYEVGCMAHCMGWGVWPIV